MPEIVVPPIQAAERCNHCGQRIRLQRKEMLNKAKVMMLKRAAEHVLSTMTNDFMTRDFTTDEEYKLYSNFQHLRYHGLIAHVKVNGQKLRKHWLITKNGWHSCAAILTCQSMCWLKTIIPKAGQISEFT